jgi:hypothetical protein
MTTLLLLCLAGEPSADEVRAFMKRLVAFVSDHHLKRDPKSEQRGMVYEYYEVATKTWVQGEALDTMHDGAWFGAALVSAFRATADPGYKDLLFREVLPFYLRMLNHSDTLFNADADHVDPKGHRFGREHRLQTGEKGFVPYWWDDGASVSLERRRSRAAGTAFSATDRLAGRPNPGARLDGWSHGSSNHLAQDLAVLLQQSWLLARETDPGLASEIAEAARNLHACRLRHHGVIGPVAAAAALSNGDRDLMQKVDLPRETTPANHYTACLDPAKGQSAPGFADDQEYAYHQGIARAGGILPRPLAFRLVYDAVTQPRLYRYWSDTQEVPPGINRFDLGALAFKGGKPASYRSDRDGGFGSRFGPQNMAVSGWALQALEALPGLWEERVPAADARLDLDGDAAELVLGETTLRLRATSKALFISGPIGGTLRIAGAEIRGAAEVVDADGVPLRFNGGAELEIPWTHVKGQGRWANPVEFKTFPVSLGDARRQVVIASREDRVKAALRRELAGGLLTWRDILDGRGYLPTGIGAGKEWEGFSDAGAYAHLLKAAAQFLLLLDGRRDWEVHRVP